MTFLQYVKDAISNFNWLNAVEVLLIALVLYMAWAYFKRRNALWLAYIAMICFVIVFVVSLLQFKGIKVYIFMLILCCIVFPTTLFAVDMRRSLFRMSWKNVLNSNKGIDADIAHEDLTRTVENIVKACQNMSKNDIGSLIVITNKQLEATAESGTLVNALLTSELLESIFFPKSPLHDGAVIVSANRIISAGCYLPLTPRLDLPKEYGTRHRAAIGMSEQNPSVTAIVVSEETGIISAMHDGKVLRYLDAETLTKVVTHALNAEGERNDELTIWGESNE